MNFISTRDKTKEVSASRAIVDGISPDGGLYVPKVFPRLSAEQIKGLSALSYIDRCMLILKKFITDIEAPALENAASAAYKNKFDEDDPAPVLKVDKGLFVLELFHGPTAAFKDIALTLLPSLMREAKRVQKTDGRTLILTATSGDTGKAALEGFMDIDGFDIIVFYPSEGVSEMQKLMMTAQEGGNLSVCAVDGNFDDCQSGVKALFADAEFNKKLRSYGVSLSSANSINIGRLLPQIVYYFSAYADIAASGEIDFGDAVNFCVPTGNFGNILAGLYAKQMGLPINKLICASNGNNILTDFFNCGVYDVNRKFFKTISPSMDILISNNLERFLFELCMRDDVAVRAYAADLKTKGGYTVTAAQKSAAARDIYAGYADEKQTRLSIKEFLNKYDYLLDPHTAVAAAVYGGYVAKTADATPTVLVSTASPYKFAADVYEAAAGVREADCFKAVKALEALTAVEVPPAIAALKTKKVLHRRACKKEGIKEVVAEYVDRRPTVAMTARRVPQ
jgi:threonine synthase